MIFGFDYVHYAVSHSYMMLFSICFTFTILQIVSELPAGTNWNFDVHWYPNIPGVISASSFDGKIGIYNIEVCFLIYLDHYKGYFLA